MKQIKKDSYQDVTNFLFEVGILSKTPRSGFHFLGTGNQTVAEHINRTIYIGYALAMLSGADSSKVLKMCLLHDIGEARISDLNYVHQMYVERKEKKAVSDLAKTLPFGSELEAIIDEYEERKTKEAVLAKDADNLEWILSLKEQVDTGNSRAKDWIISAVKRLKTPVAKALARRIVKTDSNAWWFGNRNDEWWVSRNKNKSKIRWNRN
ncbi:MAG: HD domain-containing protein [Candidatus Taylorbacteria bacterium]|nr:HD domain-containing protein [Candidatus Taylorbacteria bacterium]